ncbi:MAG: hypothetical protein IT329_23350 [Caldilineaceae bacterium]|nr:hypothetical protein [Caldilineaceae bacterium]
MTSIPPIAKIGLIAPFEGLYRPRGYAALTALRRAIERCAPPDMALIPLALDGGDTPEQSRRAAAKLNLDPAVQAVIGPLDLASAAAASEIVAERDLPWIVPALVAPAGGSASHPNAASIAPLVTALLAAQSPQPARLLIAGLPSAWQPDNLAGEVGGVPLHLLETPDTLLQTAQAGDAVLWLGLAHEAATLDNQLRAQGRRLPFWLGPAVDAAVFAAHTAGEAQWLVWQDSAPGSDTNPPLTTYIELEQALVYQAACAALAALETDGQASNPMWEVRAYRLHADGTLAPVTLR